MVIGISYDFAAICKNANMTIYQSRYDIHDIYIQPDLGYKNEQRRWNGLITSSSHGSHFTSNLTEYTVLLLY